MANVGTYFLKNPSTKFVVKNIAPGNKRVRIFQCPIANGQSRDLLAIPGISEADIRHSLLKGELLIKIKNQEIVVTESDIDLLQFNEDQKIFLQAFGIINGLEVTVDEAPTLAGGALLFAFRQNVALVGNKDGTNRTFTTPDKFINGSFHGQEFRIIIRHMGKGLEQDIDYVLLESG